MRVALVLPPTTQLNTPYPSISYLSRVLEEEGHPVHQADLGLELALRLFSAEGLSAVLDTIEAQAEDGLPEPAWEALARRDALVSTIDSVVSFLQGRDPGLAGRLCRPSALPAGPRLRQADKQDTAHHFGRMGQTDHARYRASLHLADIADLVTSTIDPGFGLARYQHHLAAGPSMWAPIAARLGQTTLLDGWLDSLADALLADARPDVVGLSVPFPGTLYGALRLGRRFRNAGAMVILGGGYPNTELRGVNESALWTCIDAITYDDGEGPMLAILDHLSGLGDRRHRTRTAAGMHDAPPPPRAFNPAPDYGNLPLTSYLGILDSLSPAHRLWSEARWNKITLAHGCYWKRCTFCDIQLDYIARYEPAKIEPLLDHIERLVEDTGVRGFHLVDEAAPPRLLRALALGILERELSVVFWGNIRFEAAFTDELCLLLAKAGMVMATGGLEVASDRLLKKMDKGVTVEQAAQAAAALTAAGIQVHAYLMYGFPTQSVAETIDSMEVVRQLFREGTVQSAYWHRFVLTKHSGVAVDPHGLGIEVPPLPLGTFAANDLPHHDPTGADPDTFDGPLATALAAWMRGDHLDRPVGDWFEQPMPAPVSPPDRVRLATDARGALRGWRPKTRVVWLGDGVLEADDRVVLLVGGKRTEIFGPEPARGWLAEVLQAAHPANAPLLWQDIKGTFPSNWDRWANQWQRVRAAGLIGV